MNMETTTKISNRMENVVHTTGIINASVDQENAALVACS